MFRATRFSFLAGVLAIFALPNMASAATPAFSVHKSGTDQTIANDTDTLLTWSTEGFDTNNNFASNRFTPTVAGKYLIVVSTYCQQAGHCLPSIRKNGTAVATGQITNTTIGQTPQVTALVDMNGSSDYVEAYATSSGTVIMGTATRTYFSGSQVDGGGGDSVGVPAGTIVAFAAASCPSGWSEYTAARGRFLRGIDNGAGIDPDGTRSPGNAQADAFATHAHSAGITNSTTGGGYLRQGDATGGTGSYSTTFTGGNETRPKNVAVTFCQYMGSGGGPAGAIVADILDFTEFKDAMTLDASTDIAASGTNVLSITNTGTGNSFVVNDQASDTTSFVIDSVGRVTIGASASSGADLGVIGSVGLWLFNPSLANGSVQTFRIGKSNAANEALGMEFKQDASASTASFHFFGDSFGQSLVLQKGGNVGIGTATPAERLHVKDGVVKVSGTAGVLQLDETDTTKQWFLVTDNNKLDIREDTTSGPNTRLSISPGGAVGIGTTAPAGTLDINGAENTGTTAALVVRSPGQVMYIDGNEIDSAAGLYLNINTNAGVFLAVGGGNVGVGTAGPSYKLHVAGQVAGNAAYVNTSDIRLKRDVEDIGYGLDTIMHLRSVSFAWKQQKEDWQQGRKLGLIAQEVEPIVPEVVSTAKDKDGTKSIAYGDLTPILIKAVQELKAANDNLKAESTELRAELRETIKSQDAEIDSLRRQIGALRARR